MAVENQENLEFIPELAATYLGFGISSIETAPRIMDKQRTLNSEHDISTLIHTLINLHIVIEFSFIFSVT